MAGYKSTIFELMVLIKKAMNFEASEINLTTDASI